MKDMENKYYTPTIEEFRVGFEYEYKCWVKSIEIWEKETYGNSNNFDHHYLDTVEDWCRDSNCRVKYLDKQDIEECGFKQLKNYWSEQLYQSKITTINETATWYEIDVEEHRILISSYMSNDDDTGSDILFRGTIKNKSELKVLLKQLGI